MQVHVAQTDITTLPVDAVVNLANSRGTMGRGVARALLAAGGNDIQAAAVERAPIAIGAALVTGGGRLPAKHVIHAPLAEEPGGAVDTENVRRAARAALIAANHNELAVIAIPGAGSKGSTSDRLEIARAIVEEIRAHKKPFPSTVYLVDLQADMIEAFEQAVDNAQHGL